MPQGGSEMFNLVFDFDDTMVSSKAELNGLTEIRKIESYLRPKAVSTVQKLIALPNVTVLFVVHKH